MSHDLWERYRKHLCHCESIGLTLDISGMCFDDAWLADMAPAMQKAYQAMDALEGGAIANPDEQRMVGHYWLRAPQLAPDAALTAEIQRTLAAVKQVAAEVHSGAIKPPTTDRFTDVLVIGIGGSALGPQFVADALGEPASDHMAVHFFDNTDPDGMARVLATIGDRLAGTLSVVISKSGGTPETRNGMLTAKAVYEAAGLNFAKHAIAITGSGSKLDQTAEAEGWLDRLPMWDWVGGRTSQTSAVGLLPAALQGVDIDAMLKGAAACDAVTRQHDTAANPAALMALMWHHATNGKGEKDLVLLPYKDRLLLLSRYLQQLIMESLGKEFDLAGQRVEQGIAVYGNKGSTDQHAYVQQLREGVNNFFVTFIEVLEEGGKTLDVEPGITSGDYLRGFMLGTRQALAENGRESMTITVPRVDAFTVGVLIALFERTVGLYATLIGINAYHQPGVEAGKKAAAVVLELQTALLDHLHQADQPQTVDQITSAVSGDPVTIHKTLEALAANGRVKRQAGATVCEAWYGV
jgi:glucose-6-phosphate isomerase